MTEENKLEGNWDKAIKDLDHLSSDILEGVQLATWQSALKLEATIVKHFQNQDLPWKALNAAYRKYKERKGLSSNILIATATLMNSVTTQQAPDKMSAFVGVLRKAKRKDKANAILVAAVHEYGAPSRNIAPRPYLRPSLKEELPNIKKRYDDTVNRILGKVGK